MDGYVDDSGNTQVDNSGTGDTTGGLNNLGGLFGGGLGTGLGLSALGTLLGTYANQQGISKASDLITQYGGQALSGLNNTIGGQINQQQANQNSLMNLGNYAQNSLQSNLGNQYNSYLQGNQQFGNTAQNYGNALGSNLNNQYNAYLGGNQQFGNVAQNYGNALGSNLNNQVNYGSQIAGNLGTNANAAQGTMGNIYGQQQAQAGANQNNLYNLYGNTQGQLGSVYNQQLGFQSPYQTTGQVGANALVSNVPYLTNQFNASDLNAQLAPNYQFSLQQGQMANQRAANAMGGGFGGNALQGLNNYTQNYAQNAYQNAFNNYQTQRQNIYGNLSNAAGLGQTSLGQLGQVGASLGQTYGNVTTGLAASQAGAQTAQAVNNANLLSNLGNGLLVNSIAGTPNTNVNLN